VRVVAAWADRVEGRRVGSTHAALVEVQVSGVARVLLLLLLLMMMMVVLKVLLLQLLLHEKVLLRVAAVLHVVVVLMRQGIVQPVRRHAHAQGRHGAHHGHHGHTAHAQGSHATLHQHAGDSHGHSHATGVAAAVVVEGTQACGGPHTTAALVGGLLRGGVRGRV